MTAIDRAALDARARTFFDGLWAEGDPWRFETAEYDQRIYERQIELLGDRRYERALELGCGAGAFTRRLAALAPSIVAIDVSEQAIATARRHGGDGIDYRLENIMTFDPSLEGPWNLIVLNETIYYLGWLYSFFDVAWLAGLIHSATANGGRLLMANTYGRADHDYLMRPWMIRTYRDLFVNAGFTAAHDEVFRGTKNDVAMEALITVFHKC